MTHDSVIVSAPVTATTLVSNYPILISVARKIKEKQRPRCKPPVIDILYRLSLAGATIKLFELFTKYFFNRSLFYIRPS